LDRTSTKNRPDAVPNLIKKYLQYFLPAFVL